MLMKKVLVSALFAAGMIAAVATPLPSMAATAHPTTPTGPDRTSR